MSTLIFRAFSPLITALTLVFAVFITLRGHNEPGGGFIGGLIAAAGFALLGLSHGVATVRRAFYFHPMSLAGFGLALATLTGLLSLAFAKPFMTGLWVFPAPFGIEIALSTPMFFDIGVFFVVSGAMLSIALALEKREGGV
jgi:multicomponent Na+:H+ antiporter subunit B